MRVSVPLASVRGLVPRAVALSVGLLGLCVAPAFAASSAPTVAVRVAGSKAPYFVLHVRPGQIRTGAVAVTDVGHVGGRVTLYPTDATTGATSGAVYLSDQQPHRGVGTWVRLTEHQLTLAPGQHVKVPFTVTVPADASAGEHLGGIVAAPDAPQTVVDRRRGKAAFGVQVREQSVIAVQTDLPGPRLRRLAVTGAGSGTEGGEQTVTIGLASTGNTLTKGAGELTVLNSHGAVRERRSFRLDTFVPHTRINYPVPVQGRALHPGHYVVHVTVRWPGGSQTRMLPLTITNHDAVQSFGSRPTAVIARAVSGRGSLPWIIGGSVAAIVALALGFVVGTRARQRPIQS